jgi:hypothetical protein
MRTAIKYKGKVTIKVKNQPPIRVKNSGTIQLFSVLCKVLARALDVNSELLPSYMSLIHNNAQATVPTDIITKDVLSKDITYNHYKDYALVLQELPISKRDVDTSGALKMSSLLNYSNLNRTNYENSAPSGVDSKGYVLLLDGDSSSKSILAFVEFNLSDLSTIYSEPNSQAVIEWEMSFDNNTEEEDA